MTSAKRQQKILQLLGRFPNGRLDSSQIAQQTNLLGGELLPALIHLEGQSLIASEWADRKQIKPGEAKRRLYWITEAGIAALEQLKAA